MVVAKELWYYVSCSRPLLAMTHGLFSACRLGEGELGLRVRMAYGMFDTRGRCQSLLPYKRYNTEVRT